MNALLNLFALNLMALPAVSFLLLISVPAGNLAVFRGSSAAFFFLLNVLLIRAFKWEFHRPRLLQSALLAGAAIAAFAIFYRYSLQPMGGSWDTYGLWNLKGRDYTEMFFLGRKFQLIFPDWHHPGYPLVIPLSVALLQINFGGWSETLPEYFYFLFFVLQVGVLYVTAESVRRFYPSVFFILAALFLLPILTTASNQGADYPIATMFTFALLQFFKFEERPAGEIHSLARSNGGRLEILLLSLGLGYCLLTKEEGILMNITFFGVFFLFSRFRFDFRFWKVFVGPFAAAVILWVAYKALAPEKTQFEVTPAQIMASLFDWGRYTKFPRYFAFIEKMIVYADIAVLAFSVIFCKVKRHYLLVPVLLLAEYFLVLVITTMEQEYHIGTALGRLHAQAIQVLMFTALFLQRGEGKAVEAG